MAQKQEPWMKVGTKVRIIGTISGHGQSIGAVVTLTRPYNSTGWYARRNKNSAEIYIMFQDFEKDVKTKEDLIKEIEEIEAQILVQKNKLQFLEETKANVLNIDEFKSYCILQISEDKNLNRQQKTKAINEVINSK